MSGRYAGNITGSTRPSTDVHVDVPKAAIQTWLAHPVVSWWHIFGGHSQEDERNEIDEWFIQLLFKFVVRSLLMPRSKTLLSVPEQWERTVKYVHFLHQTKWTNWENWVRGNEYRAKPLEEEALRFLWQQERDAGPRVDERHELWVVRGTHRLLLPGDILIATRDNGMNERYPMTGVTSKGARLNNYRLPFRAKYWEGGSLSPVELPGDLITLKWDDPAVGRFVADLRASSRSRVGASSPAISHCKTSFGIDTNETTYFGLYKSGRTSKSTRTCDYREYLRFYPDGSVVSTHDFNRQGWRISFDPERISPEKDPYVPMGIVHIEGKCLTFELFDWGKVFYARYEGQFENGRLWLTCDSPHDNVAHGKLPYRFHPFNPDAF